MSLTLSPSAIAVLALRRVRRVAPFETGGGGPELAITLQHLDLIMGELAGTERLWWLTTVDVPLEVTAGQQDYDLSGIQTPDPLDIIRAAWIDANLRRHPLCLYRLDDWDGLDDRLHREAGEPEGIYVQHTPASKLWVYPIPTEDGTIHLTQQVIAADITNNSDNPAELPTAWQRYFVLALAAEIGSGPIERLSEQEINRLSQQAANSKNILLARHRKENVQRPRFVKPWDPTL